MASGGFTITFAKQHPRQCQPALDAGGPLAGKAPDPGCIATLLPQQRLRTSEQGLAAPVRIVGNERRIPAETRLGVWMTEDKPLDELLARRIADGLFDLGGFAQFSLA